MQVAKKAETFKTIETFKTWLSCSGAAAVQAAADMFNEFLVVKRAWQLHQMQTRKGVLVFSLNRTIDIKNNLLFCKNKSIKWTLLFLPFWGRLYISYFLQQLAYASQISV